jgi:hypothetical protein
MVPGMTIAAVVLRLDDFDADRTGALGGAGDAPNAFVAKGKAFPGVERPICAYPTVARYDGKGPLTSAASFACAGAWAWPADLPIAATRRDLLTAGAWPPSPRLCRDGGLCKRTKARDPARRDLARHGWKAHSGPWRLDPAGRRYLLLVWREQGAHPARIRYLALGRAGLCLERSGELGRSGLIIPPVPDDPASPLHPAKQLDRPHILYNAALPEIHLLGQDHGNRRAPDPPS